MHCFERFIVKFRYVPKKHQKSESYLRSKQLDKEKTPLHIFGMPATKNLKIILEAKLLDEKRGDFSEKDQELLDKLYTQGSAYGSIPYLMKASKLSKTKENFLAGTDAHTKYRTPRKKIR